jgi:hypothetical protein
MKTKNNQGQAATGLPEETDAEAAARLLKKLNGRAADLFSIVSSAEGDMRRVYDHAYLLYDYLCRREPISEDLKDALSWPASDLLEAGRRLRDHCDALYALASEQKKGGAK